MSDFLQAVAIITIILVWWLWSDIIAAGRRLLRRVGQEKASKALVEDLEIGLEVLIANVEALCCDPQGRSIVGSPGDRRALDEALQAARALAARRQA